MDIVPAMEIPTDRVSYYFGETRLQLILDQRTCVGLSIFFDFCDHFFCTCAGACAHVYFRDMPWNQFTFYWDNEMLMITVFGNNWATKVSVLKMEINVTR